MFQYQGGNMMRGAQLQQRRQEHIFDQISQGIVDRQRQQELDLKKRQLEAASGEFDFDKMADIAMTKHAMGQPLSPQEQGVLKAWQARQRPLIDSTTGQVYAPPNIFDALLPGNSAPPGYDDRGGGVGPEQPGFNFDQLLPGEPENPMSQTPKGKMKSFETDENIREKKAETKTKAEEKLNEKFINDVMVPYQMGGAADSNKQINQISEVIDMLGKENITGGVQGFVPTFARGIVNQRSVDAQEKVEEVVQRNLREVLGAQFTEKEGTRLINRAYNPRLDESINKKRLESLQQSMIEAAAAKQDAIQYFENNGTLSGWSGKMPTIQDIESRFDELSGGGDQSGPQKQSKAQKNTAKQKPTKEQALEILRKRGRIQ